MISKNQIKFIKTLHKSKNRKQENKFIVEGVKVVDEFINSKFSVLSIYATAEWIAASDTLAENIVEVSISDLKKISILKTPNQVLAVVAYPENNVFKYKKGDLVLALDTIQDPGNMGTIIRIADWFGIKNIVCSMQTADVYNPKVVQATMGALTRVGVHYVDLVQYLSALPTEVNIYGTLLDGDNMYDTNLSEDGVIVVGNEGNGISDEVQKVLSHRIKIPAYGNSMMESLNVAIATSLVCAEFRR